MQYRVRKPLSSTIVDYNVLNPCIACVVYKTTQLIDIFIITLYVRVNKYVYIYIYIYITLNITICINVDTIILTMKLTVRIDFVLSFQLTFDYISVTNNVFFYFSINCNLLIMNID